MDVELSWENREGFGLGDEKAVFVTAFGMVGGADGIQPRPKWTLLVWRFPHSYGA